MRLAIAWAVFTFIFFHEASAQTLPLDPSQFGDPNSLLDGATTTAVVKAVGLITDHRSYQPATPLGTSIGVDVGIETTLAKVPPDFIDALESAGINTNVPPAIPLPRLLVHKGLGQKVEVGLSFVGYQQYRIYGGSFKLAVSQPPEGLTWAIRINYANAKMGFVKTQTLSTQVLASRKLAFADPYIGAGWAYTLGSITVPVPLPSPLTGTVDVSGDGNANALMAFLGVALRMGPTGIKITLEGSYNQKEVHTLGAKVGFEF